MVILLGVLILPIAAYIAVKIEQHQEDLQNKINELNK